MTKKGNVSKLYLFLNSKITLDTVSIRGYRKKGIIPNSNQIFNSVTLVEYLIASTLDTLNTDDIFFLLACILMQSLVE